MTSQNEFLIIQDKREVEHVEQCLLVEKNEEKAWLWDRRLCHQSFHTVQDISRSNHVEGLAHFAKYDH